MATLNDAYKSIADINLWFKIRGGDNLMLSDVPSIIVLRWNWFKNNWNFIKSSLVNSTSKDTDPDFLKQQIDDFSNFIETQRNSKINPFQDGKIFYKYYAVFNNILIKSINLTNEEQRLLKNEIARVSAFSKNNFLDAKNNIIDYRDRVTDIVGLGDQDYNVLVGRSPIPSQVTATITNANYLLTLQSSIRSCDFILANLFAVDASFDPFALARANANNPDVSIGQYKSGKLVKINYGESLESLANRYLGDQNKWIDIAIANGLKPPYIDEVGVKVPLLSNGSVNKINVAKVDSNGNPNIEKFYINQPVFLQSNAEVVVNQRSIVSIKEIPVSGEIILELDGDTDMDRYKLVDQAYVRVFAPNTVNSSFYVLIPSPNPLPYNRDDEVPWFLAKSGQDEKQAKVDLAIDDSGDLMLTSNGDVMLSYGLDNAIQAIKLKIITELGSLKFHPTFGLVNIIGTKNLDIEGTKGIITESINSQIQADSRFDRVENLSVQYLVNSGNNQGVGAIAISLVVRLAGGTKSIPISFTVNNS